jgi:hypothetical protein
MWASASRCWVVDHHAGHQVASRTHRHSTVGFLQTAYCPNLKESNGFEFLLQAGTCALADGLDAVNGQSAVAGGDDFGFSNLFALADDVVARSSGLYRFFSPDSPFHDTRHTGRAAPMHNDMGVGDAQVFLPRRTRLLLPTMECVLALHTNEILGNAFSQFGFAFGVFKNSNSSLAPLRYP